MPKRLILPIFAGFFNGPFPQNNSNNNKISKNIILEKTIGILYSYFNLLNIVPNLLEFFNKQ